jgi:hypothetical protein
MKIDAPFFSAEKFVFFFLPPFSHLAEPERAKKKKRIKKKEFFLVFGQQAGDRHTTQKPKKK